MYSKTFSASSMKTYLMCPFKYYMRYDLKLKQQQSHYSCFGKIIHHILQVCARFKARYNTHIQKPRLDKLILATLDRTNLFQLYQKKSLVRDRDEVVGDISGMVYDIMGRQGPSQPMNHNIIAAEQRFEFNISKQCSNDTFKFIGYIDLCVKHDDDTIQIIDYKTGKAVLNYKTVNQDIQSRLYDLAASKMFPDNDIIITFENIRPDKKSVSTVFHQQQRNEFEGYLFDLAFEIKHNTQMRLVRRPYQHDKYVSYKCKYLCGYYEKECDRCYKKYEQKN